MDKIAELSGMRFGVEIETIGISRKDTISGVYRKGYRKIRENHAQKNAENCCQENGRLFDSSKMEIKKMRCVIYTRVSTEDQTVENQISQLKEYAERQNWNIIDIVSDVASGGKSANERSGLKKVLAMARQRKYDVLLFWSLDRFSREGSRKTLEYLSKLDDFQVKWHSYTEEYISSLGIFADAIISLMACLAKQERIRISERTKAGLERVRSRGKKLGRPQTADVTAIRELRQQGFSLAQIALRCNISRARVHQILSA